MTLRELRAEVVVQTLQQRIHNTNDEFSCSWIEGRCRQCRRSEATIACIHRGRIHPWRCIHCTKNSAEPATLSERWQAMITKRPYDDWKPIWERCLAKSVNDGISADDDLD